MTTLYDNRHTPPSLAPSLAPSLLSITSLHHFDSSPSGFFFFVFFFFLSWSGLPNEGSLANLANIIKIEHMEQTARFFDPRAHHPFDFKLSSTNRDLQLLALIILDDIHLERMVHQLLGIGFRSLVDLAACQESRHRLYQSLHVHHR